MDEPKPFLAGVNPTKKRCIGSWGVKTPDLTTKREEGELKRYFSWGEVGLGFFLASFYSLLCNDLGTRLRCVSLAVFLPSVMQDFTVCVLGGVRELKLIVKWPETLPDLNLLHCKLLTPPGSDKIKTYHPKYLKFEEAPKRVRGHVDDVVQFTAWISLLFLV